MRGCSLKNSKHNSNMYESPFSDIKAIRQYGSKARKLNMATALKFLVTSLEFNSYKCSSCHNFN